MSIKTGKFGLCSNVWSTNGDTKSLIPATESDIMKCCLQTAAPWTEMCLERCKKMHGPDSSEGTYQDYINCRYNCGRMVLATENACALSNPGVWRGNSPIIPCITKFGCGTYPNYDKECIRKNKDGLVSCCNSGCWPTSTMSCTQHCSLKYYDIVGETKDPLIKKFDDSVPYEETIYNTSKKNNSWIWYLVALGISVIILIAIRIIIIR